jgi:site-specific recombinase XerD
MKSTVSFQALLQRFFTDRLMQQRQASAHTISSYRDTFRLLLRFAHKSLHKTPDQLAFEDIDAPLVAAFLNDLEKTRDISARILRADSAGPFHARQAAQPDADPLHDAP